MGRLRKVLERKREAKQKALVVYLTASDPDYETSLAAAKAAIKAGADVLEIGVPFSDPVADGPVIQRAMQRALQQGGGLEAALRLVAEIREQSDTPIVLFGYLNPLLWLGLEKTFEKVAAAGGDGLLVVDLPSEEDDAVRDLASSVGLEWVSLIAPTTGAERARVIAQKATGFLYAVSMTGVTGGALPDLKPVAEVIDAARSRASTPICIGFGIRDAKSARRAAKLCDGVVVGSAIVAALESTEDGKAGVEGVARCVAELRSGLDAMSP